ncbi:MULTISPECIES: hypothetical protein [Rhodococcus]|uniref:Uncharacterized protein n=1 Tax=Rhodococcus pyridinivorans KG-16 TaxID=1441730 RepID=A0A0V9UNU6_9NOCA|nr:MULTISPECIES: hypothetical protein [Rhodococcus]KSZ59663.1 hypothetical protein Z045_05690 [Rhodococcus pyridinivorans KG-16]QOH56253.1 hypothetical protein C6Y44_09955 [Rhodococcus rhodochrous]
MYEETTQRILDLMKQTFGTHEGGGPFKEFYDGDPDEIPAFNLPCIVVDQTNDDTDKGAWGQDDVTDTIMIKVIFNKADDWTANIDPNDLTSRKIRRIIAARDPKTGRYLPNTVKGALRAMGTKGLTAVGGNLSVEYGMVPRVNGDKGLLTQEGWVRFTIEYPVDVEEAA